MGKKEERKEKGSYEQQLLKRTNPAWGLASLHRAEAEEKQ